MLNIATNSIFVLVLFGLGSFIVVQGIIGIHSINLGGEEVAWGRIRLISIPLICILGFLFIRWFKLNGFAALEVRNIVYFTFGLYALDHFVGDFIRFFYLFKLPQDPSSGLIMFYVIYRIPTFCLSVIFGLSLFRLSSLVLKRKGLDAGFLLTMLVCLGSYGSIGIYGLYLDILEYYASGLPTFMYLLMNKFGFYIKYFSILFLAIDIFLKKSLRKRSVYITLLSKGVAHLLSEGPGLLRILAIYIETAHLSELHMVWILAKIPMILSYILVIVVSYSLVRGGKWEGWTFKLSLAAVFLFVSGLLIVNLYSIFYGSLPLIANPHRIFEDDGMLGLSVAEGLISLAFPISLLTIGLWLYRERASEEKAPAVVSKSFG